VMPGVDTVSPDKGIVQDILPRLPDLD
jgi:hypothetical protein